MFDNSFSWNLRHSLTDQFAKCGTVRYNTFDECRTKMKKKKTFQKNKIKHELKHVLDFQYKSNDACTLTFDFSKYFPDDENNALYLCKYWRRLTNQPYSNKSYSCNKRAWNFSICIKYRNLYTCIYGMVLGIGMYMDG